MSLEGELALENTEFKNTQKLTWLADCGPAQATPTICYHFDHIITKGVLKPEDNFEDYINYNSKVTTATLFRALSLKWLWYFTTACFSCISYSVRSHLVCTLCYSTSLIQTNIEKSTYCKIRPCTISNCTKVVPKVQK